MNRIKKCIAIVLYLFLIMVFFKFDILILFDIKQIFLVFTGAIIMYMPIIISNKKFIFDNFLFAQNALWASIIQTFVQLFGVMAKNSNNMEINYNIALACRPLLYGFCIWVIFHTDETIDREEMHKEEIHKDNMSNNVSDKTVDDNVLSDAAMCRVHLVNMGLTKRETEVAMLVMQEMSNAQIASELYISETTVKKHISNIFSKLNISKREQIREIIRKM